MMSIHITKIVDDVFLELVNFSEDKSCLPFLMTLVRTKKGDDPNVVGYIMFFAHHLRNMSIVQ